MLDTLGNLGDFIGGIAVLVTLIYLAIQIRQHTAQAKEASEIARADTYARSVASYSEFRSLLISDAGMADIYMRGCEDPRSLTPVERLRFYLILQQMFFTVQATWDNSTTTGTQMADPAHMLGLDYMLKQPGIRGWWAHEKTRYGPNFVALVNKQLEQSE